MSNETQAVVKRKANPFDIFIDGARKGFHIATYNLMPNVLMAYTLAEILRILGVLAFLGNLFGPLMGVFGLPGQAVTVLLTSWLSVSAGIGVAVSLLGNEVINGWHMTILMPACFLMGSQIQYMGRLLGVADVPKRYWPMLMAISIINAMVSMFIMRFFV